MDNKIGKKGEGGVSERDKSDGNSNVIENKGKSNTTPPTTSGKLKKEEQGGQKEIEEIERERERENKKKQTNTKLQNGAQKTWTDRTIDSEMEGR